MTKYLLDSNALIDAYDKLYPIGVFGSVWKWLITSKKFFITKQVYEELMAYDGDLKIWIQGHFEKNELIDEFIAVQEYALVADFLTSSGYWSEAGSGLWLNTSKADPWLIAYGMHDSDCVIVTHENSSNPNPNSNSRKEPKIPFVASKNNVQVQHLWEVFSNENAVF